MSLWTLKTRLLGSFALITLLCLLSIVAVFYPMRTLHENLLQNDAIYLPLINNYFVINSELASATEQFHAFLAVNDPLAKKKALETLAVVQQAFNNIKKLELESKIPKDNYATLELAEGQLHFLVLVLMESVAEVHEAGQTKERLLNKMADLTGSLSYLSSGLLEAAHTGAVHVLPKVEFECIARMFSNISTITPLLGTSTNHILNSKQNITIRENIVSFYINLAALQNQKNPEVQQVLDYMLLILSKFDELYSEFSITNQEQFFAKNRFLDISKNLQDTMIRLNDQRHLAMASRSDSILALTTEITSRTIMGVVAIIILGMWLALRLTHTVLAPIKRLVKYAQQVSAGHFDERLPLNATGQMDEVNQLSHQLNTMVDTLSAALSSARLQQDQIRSTQTMLTTVLENIPGSVCMRNADGHITYVNQSFLLLNQITHEEALGKLVFRDVPQNTYARISNMQNRVKQTRSPIKDIFTGNELGFVDPTQYYSVTMAPLLNNQGEADSVLTFAINVTELRELQESLLTAKEQAEKALQVKNSFVANISHELRTPLNAIIGLTHLLMQSPLTSWQLGHLEKVRYSSHNLLNLINDLLDFSKMEAGKLKLENVPFELKQVLEHVLATLEPSAKPKGIELNMKIGEGVPAALMGDPLRLSQVLLNFGSNAVKFTNDGSVTFEVTFVRNLIKRSFLHFSVKDTGIGLEMSKLELLFEAFSQADASTTRLYGGTGLGLSICKQLVQQMNGEISVSSISGKGSEFCFTASFGLPSSNTKILPISKENDEDQPISLHNIKLLVVEDNEINQIIMDELLTAEGIRVTLTDNGQQAVNTLLAMPDGDPYDMILMDLQMPIMDGFEATRVIRDNPRFDTIPIIALTANTMPGDREKCLDAGMQEHMGKPILLKQLVEMLAKWKRSSVPLVDRGAE